MTPETTREYVGNVVRKVLKKDGILDEDDIFQYGCDRYVRTGVQSSTTR